MSSDGVKLGALSNRMTLAVNTLVQADQANPQVRLTQDNIKANPYMTARGFNGLVESNEARSVNDPLARSFYEVAASSEGETYTEGGGGTWTPKIMQAFDVNYGELRRFEQHVEGIVKRLDGDGDGQIVEADLQRLPQVIKDYFTELYHGDRVASAKLSPIFHQRVEGLIREMFTLERKP